MDDAADTFVQKKSCLHLEFRLSDCDLVPEHTLFML